MRMFNPVHPGVILREWMGDEISVTALSERIGLSKVKVSSILNGRRPVSADVALRLGEVFPHTDAEFWLRLQNQYDLAQLRMTKRKPIKPIRS